MSTNIRIDVTLQKLQEVANETTEKNREEKKAREDDLAFEAKAAELSGERDGSVPPLGDLVDSLGQPLSRTGEPPSEKQKPNQADKSSVPNTYKKLDPGAGAVPLLFRPVHCWLQQTLGSSTTNGSYVVYSADGTASASFSYSTDAAPDAFNSQIVFDLSNDEITYRRFWSALVQSFFVVFPVDSNSLILAYYARRQYYGSAFSIATEDLGLEIPSNFTSTQRTTTQAECFLVGKDFVRSIGAPSRLVNFFSRIAPDFTEYPIDQEDEPNTSWYSPVYYQLLEDYPTFVDGDGNTVVSITVDGETQNSFVQLSDNRLNVKGLEVNRLRGRVRSIQGQDFNTLYSHYIVSNGPLTAAPAVYYWLKDYQYDVDAPDFYENYQQIRVTFPAIYGRSQGDRFYGALFRVSAEGRQSVEWYEMPPPTDLVYASDQIAPGNVQFPDGTTKQINRYGSFTGAGFTPTSFAQLVVAWDGNQAGYCRGQLGLLGFTDTDLTPPAS